jgi:hypothetical protein
MTIFGRAKVECELKEEHRQECSNYTEWEVRRCITWKNKQRDEDVSLTIMNLANEKLKMNNAVSISSGW